MQKVIKLNMRVNRMINEAVSRFVVKTFEATSADAYIDMLDVLESWESYRQEQINGYVVDPKLISKKIGEIFKDARVEDIRVYGIKKKVPMQQAKKQLTDEEREQLAKDSALRTRFEKFVYDRGPEFKTKPFETSMFSNFKQTSLTDGFYSLGIQECSLEEAEAWLSRQEFLYFDEKINKWVFHSRPI